MDWRTILSTFGLIFLAELGDKTQLACIGMACRVRSPLAVFPGAVGALSAVTLIGVVFGEALANLIPVWRIFGKHLEPCSWSLGLRSCYLARGYWPAL